MATAVKLSLRTMLHTGTTVRTRYIVYIFYVRTRTHLAYKTTGSIVARTPCPACYNPISAAATHTVPACRVYCCSAQQFSLSGSVFFDRATRYQAKRLPDHALHRFLREDGSGTRGLSCFPSTRYCTTFIMVFVYISSIQYHIYQTRSAVHPNAMQVMPYRFSRHSLFGPTTRARKVIYRAVWIVGTRTKKLGCNWP